MRVSDESAPGNPVALVVDRDPSVRAIIRDVLEEGATMTVGASGAAEAMEMLRSHPVSLMLVDIGHSRARATSSCFATPSDSVRAPSQSSSPNAPTRPKPAI